MELNRSVSKSVVVFLLALLPLFQITRLGGFYGNPFVGGIALGLVSGHLLICAGVESRRVPLDWRVLYVIATFFVFMGLPVVFLRRWPHSITGFGAALFAIIGLEVSVLSLVSIRDASLSNGKHGDERASMGDDQSRLDRQ